MKKQNLIGKVYDRLTVISSGKIMQEGCKKVTTWNCACECGNIIIAKTYNLNRKGVRSCGCLKNDLKVKLKINQKFGKLTTISYNYNSVWLCHCECGNTKLIKSEKLTTGKTKSCGCLRKQTSKLNMQKALIKRKKYEPYITSARRIWQSYCRMDNCKIKTFNISFDNFYKLSKMNCYYCDMTPNNNFNIFKYKYYKGSEQAKLNGNFNYNGLDRIDNAKPHTIDNCVSCCIICNRAKSNFSLVNFNNYIKELQLNSNIVNIDSTSPSNNLLKKNVNIIYNKNYNDGDLNLNQFYSLSKLNCHYCNSLPSNINNYFKNHKKITDTDKINSIFKYNGLDKVDSSLKHDMQNVVTCCKRCNFAKNNISYQEFKNWIIRIKNKNA